MTTDQLTSLVIWIAGIGAVAFLIMFFLLWLARDRIAHLKSLIDLLRVARIEPLEKSGNETTARLTKIEDHLQKTPRFKV